MKYIFRKSIFASFLFFSFFACEEIPDGVITPAVKSYQITGIQAPEIFKFSKLDSTFLVSINIKGTILPIQDPLGFIQNAITRETLTAIKLLDIQQAESGGIITATANGSVQMSKSFASGQYNLVFESVDTETTIRTTIAEHKFIYDNGSGNVRPELSNIKIYYMDEQPILRDTVDRDKNIIFSVQAADSNGLNDITKVSFDLFRPDNSLAGNFIMFDDGDSGHGDAKAGDGIYSLMNSFSTTSSIGNWKFDFTATDNENEISNTITHNLFVK